MTRVGFPEISPFHLGTIPPSANPRIFILRKEMAVFISSSSSNPFSSL
jgi:hypothetical protein